MSAHQRETNCPPVTGGGHLCNIFCQCLLENLSCGISFWAAFSIFDTDHVACLCTVILAAVFVVLDDNNFVMAENFNETVNCGVYNTSLSCCIALCVSLSMCLLLSLSCTLSISQYLHTSLYT